MTLRKGLRGQNRGDPRRRRTWRPIPALILLDTIKAFRRLLRLLLPLRQRTQWHHPPVLRYMITRRSSQTVSNRLRAATDLIRQVLGIGEHRCLRTTGAGSNELAYQASWVVLRDRTSSKSRNTPDRERYRSHQSTSFLSVDPFSSLRRRI